MRIGIDFDNTIANYEGLFHKTALRLGLIDEQIGRSKEDVKNFLNGQKKEHEFTMLQGLIYGRQIAEAVTFPGFEDFLNLCESRHATIYIVSHKSKYPIIGPKYNLHEAAINFIHSNQLLRERALSINQIFFESTKDNKIQRACKLSLDYFVDDLPEIVNSSKLRAATKTILFDPNGKEQHSCARTFKTWSNISKFIFDE